MSHKNFSTFSHHANRLAQPLVLDRGFYTPGRYPAELIVKSLLYITDYLNEHEPVEMTGPATVQSVMESWGYVDACDFVDLAIGFGFRPWLNENANNRILMDYLDDDGIWLDAMFTMATELDESQFVWSSNRVAMAKPRTNYDKKYTPPMGNTFRSIVKRMAFDCRK